ncbi:IclR family transcriptional regulator [Herbiconiux sp. A18JL235]|uniref:Glycerol operon regulatory protein n=1 Tax=Herbiconiux sp. A18JL235 TaxID=3152363 RepID=A0AB39BHC3_9MICO
MVDESTGTPERSGVKSSLRTLEILELLASDDQRRTITSIARELGSPKSSVHSIVHTMADRGWLQVSADGTRYGLGIRSLLAGTSYIETDDVVTLTRGTLDAVAERTGETVHLGRLDGADVVYLAKRESVHPLRLYSAVGRRLPAHATALGKALLAQLEPQAVDAALGPGPLRALTPATITDRARLDDELASVREAGIAHDRGENSAGISCFAVAIGRGSSLNAISCSLPDARLTDAHRDEIVTALSEGAREADSLLSRFGA